MTSNNYVWTAVAFAAALLVSGCGGGGGDDSSPPPTTPTYTIGGSISGLSGTVALDLNIGGGVATGELSRSTNGAFTFSTAAFSGESYAVTVQTQPSGQTCTVTNGSGLVGSSNITNVSVTCATNRTIGGSVSGLNGALHLQIAINGVVSSTLRRLDENGSFTFTQTVASGDAYVVSVASQPTGQTCTVGNGIGTVGSVNVTNVSVTCTTTGTIPTLRTVGGSLSGLTGTVVLRMAVDGVALGSDLTLAANGSFTFPHKMTTGQAYGVSIQTQPAGQTCTVSNGSGVIASANVTNVSVTCAAAVVPTFTIGGTVSGLTGTVILRMTANGVSQDRTVTSNGGFTFTEALPSGQAYSIAVQSQPTGQTCAVSNGSGTVAGANVTNVSVVCTTNSYTIGGSMSGLSGTVVLQITVGGVVVGSGLSVSANGSFTFPNTVTSGSGYVIQVQTQPSGQTCTVSNGSGTVGTSNVVNVSVACTTITPQLSCPANDGSSVGGLGFFGTVSYSGLISAASTFDSSISSTWGIRYSNSSRSSSSFTGSIRISLWAVSSSFNGGTIVGTRIVRWTPNFTGPGARDSDQLFNFSTASGTTTGSGTTPPRGTYCLVLTLDEFNPALCSSADDFCYTDFRQFSTPVTFQ